MASILNRMVRAAKLDKTAYEEVEADSGATGQALLVIVLANVATAAGTYGLSTGGSPIMSIVNSLLSYSAFAAIVYLVGGRMLPEAQTDAGFGQLLRTIGFAASPQILNVLGIIPGLIVIVGPITLIWWVVATIVAVRQALDYQSTARAIGVCILAAIGYLIVQLVLGLAFLGGP